MSADSVLVFFGVRTAVADQETEALELRSDPRQRAARKLGLDTYWGNFGGTREEQYLFVGRVVANAGPENPRTVSLDPERLAQLIDETAAKLRAAGIEGEPHLWVQYQPDV